MGFSRVYNPVLHFDDINGRPLVGGSLYSFLAGTATPATTYRDKDGHEANENPIPLNERGECTVWIPDGIEYKFLLLDSSGNVIWSADNVTTQGGDVGAMQSDWDCNDPTSMAFIKNRPNLAMVATSGDYEDLENKPDIPAEQVQSDWNESSAFSKAFIKNKPNLALVATTGNYNDLINKPVIPTDTRSDWNETNPLSSSYILNKPDVRKGKLHRISVRSVQADDPSPKPQADWIIDLESPNPNEPDGYDRLTVTSAIEIHENGEVFAFASSASNTDTYYESFFNSSPGYVHMTLVRSGFHQRPNEVSLVTVDVYGDYLGISDAFQDSEYWNATLVQEGSDELRQNKIHRYSFGDATIDGETPVYGSWLIDLDKPDPNGPEGYSRVTPAEFWKATAVNGEVPVYLQEKNSNNSLTYAYLSRADVTKSGNTVTNVLSYFVRSGYGNDLSQSMGFRFTKYPGSDYLQKASATDDSFEAFSADGVLPIANGGTNASTVADARTNLDVYSKAEVNTAIDTAVASAYHAAGTKTVAQLTNALLVAANLGNVYNITDSGTTTADFVDGAGHPIEAGDNVGICDVGGGVYKFDLLSGFVDLSGYKAKQTAVTDPTADGDGLSFIDSASQNANGEVTLHKKNVQDGTTSQKGVVQLEDSVSSTATDKAATPKAVKTAYDLISSKANDADVVHKAGAETITGVKVFQNDLSPRIFSNSSCCNQQSKTFLTGTIKTYGNWTLEEKDGNHFRQWTIDLTTALTTALYIKIKVKFEGSYENQNKNGVIEKTISAQIFNSGIVSTRGDYTIVQYPAYNEFVVSDLIKENNKFVVKIIAKTDSSNSHPNIMIVEFSSSSTTVNLNGVACTGEIIEGWPSWAGDINTPVRVTASGSPVLTEATAATVAKTGSYSDLTGKPLVYWSSQYDAALVAVSDGIYKFDIAWPTGIDTTKNYILEVTALFSKDASELSQLNGDDLPFNLSLLTTGHLVLGTCAGVMTSLRATTGDYYGNTSLMTRITSSMITGSTLYCQLAFPKNILTLADTFVFTVRLRFTEAP